MPPLSVGTVLKAALIAGLLAGTLVAVFHRVVTEPVIDQAIALEEQLHPSDDDHEAPVVSRDVQRGGLILGYLIYGLTWATLLGAVFVLAQRWLPGPGVALQGGFLGLLGYWSLGLFPFLKYPANPPGVGEPETIAYRQGLYLAALALTILGSLLAVVVGRQVARRATTPWVGWLAGVAFLAVYSLIVYLGLPANPDAIRLPMEIVASFRALSIVGLTLFWVALILAFGALLRRASGGSRLSVSGPAT